MPERLPAIERRIRDFVRLPGAAMDARVIALRRRAGRWRIAAIAASVVAALLAVGLRVRGDRPRCGTEYVAILQKDAASPAFEVTVDLDRQELTVRPVAARAPPGSVRTGSSTELRPRGPRRHWGGARRAASSPASIAPWSRARPTLSP